MMKSAVLFYRKLVSKLQEMGFEINPYNPGVANKMVNGTQMMIRWHVDDLMISYLSHDKIMKVVQGIKDIDMGRTLQRLLEPLTSTWE